MGFVGVPLFYMRGIINRRGMPSLLYQYIHNERTAYPESPFDVYINVLAELHEDWLTNTPEPAIGDPKWDIWHSIHDITYGSWCPICNHEFAFESVEIGRKSVLEHSHTCPIWEIMDVEIDYDPATEFKDVFQFRNRFR